VKNKGINLVITFFIIIIGALLVGGATTALFTSTAENTLNSFQSGVLEVNLDRNDGDYYFEIENIAPGDSGGQTISIVNSGTLNFNYQVSYTLSGVLAEGDHPLSIVIKDSNQQPIDLALQRELKNNSHENLTISWEMPLEAGNQYQGGTARLDLEVLAEQITGNVNIGTASYHFPDLSPNNFQTTGNWSKNSQGFTSNFGLLFIPNNKDVYTLVSNVSLHEGLYSSGTSGGYGIMFETSISSDGNDTGYILQFDRGYGAITIRRRTNGYEASPIIVVRHQDHPTIPAEKDHPWWTDQHEVKIYITRADNQPDMKSLRVMIDNETLINNLLINPTETGLNHIGLRSWQANSTFLNITVH